MADSVLRLQLAERSALRVHAVDVDPAVVGYLQDVNAGRITRLSIATELSRSPGRTLTEEYRRYFDAFGARIGKRAQSAIEIDRRIAALITAERLDIITQRAARAGDYDLVVATNVFAYFSDAELALALTNIAAMLKEGGYRAQRRARRCVPCSRRGRGIADASSRRRRAAAARSGLDQWRKPHPSR